MTAVTAGLASFAQQSARVVTDLLFRHYDDDDEEDGVGLGKGCVVCAPSTHLLSLYEGAHAARLSSPGRLYCVPAWSGRR